MQPKKTAKEIEQEIAENATVVVSLSKRPYSFVHLWYETYGGSGFAKCCATDEWDEAKGIEIAARRAARDIRKQLEEEER